jgi:ferredoxin-NADP reductase
MVSMLRTIHLQDGDQDIALIYTYRILDEATFQDEIRGINTSMQVHSHPLFIMKKMDNIIHNKRNNGQTFYNPL